MLATAVAADPAVSEISIIWGMSVKESKRMPKTAEGKKLPVRVVAVTAGGIWLGLALVSPSGSALAAPEAWEGYATVMSSTPQCAGVEGTTQGSTHVSIFRPKIANTNSPSFLSFVFLRAALTHRNASKSTVHQMNGSGNYTGFSIGPRAGFAQYTGTYKLTLTPATIIPTTASVTILDMITNFFNTTGCNVSFEGTYVQRID